MQEEQAALQRNQYEGKGQYSSGLEVQFDLVGNAASGITP